MAEVITLITEYWDILIATIVPRFFEFITSPFENWDMLWILIPLLAALTLMEVYFGRNKTEELGWGTAFGNTVALFFVMATLIKYMLQNYTPNMLFGGGPPTYKLMLVALLGLQALILMWFNYHHTLHKKLAFMVSSSLPISVTAVLAIILVMADFPFDYVTLGAALFTFIVFWILYTILQTLIEPSPEAKMAISRKKHKRDEERKQFYQHIKHKLNRFKNRMISHFKPPEELR